MVHGTHWWVMGTSAALLSLNTAHAQLVPEELTVRIYNTAAVPKRDIAAAERLAESIFDRARIRLRWRECRTANGPSAASDDLCAEQLQPREVIARVAVIGGAPPSTSVLGYALVDGRARVGTLATIFADRVSAAADRLQIEPATLLGRTLSHELAHLLLGTTSHPRRGLMRAWWTDAGVQRARGSDWHFSEQEAAHLNTALAARAGGAPGVQAATRPRREPRT